MKGLYQASSANNDIIKFCGSVGVGQISRASDISRKKEQNFAGFSGANSRKMGQFRGIFAGEKSKFAEKSADFAGF